MIHIVGHTAFDHIIRVPSLPERHQSTFVCGHDVLFGGGAANIAAAVARLGGEVTLLSAVGSDFAGSDYEGWLEGLGVRLDFFVVDGARTATAYIFTDEADDQMTFFEWGASSVFSEKEAPPLNFVHMATADPDFNVRIARASTYASFDPGQDLLRYSKLQLEEIIDHIDILFANRHEVATMCGVLGISADELVGRVPIAVFTMDEKGSTLYYEDRVHVVPIARVPLVDPTGAGDAYRAGFLTAFQQGFDPLQCCRVGTVVASFVVEKAGCQTNLPEWGQMKARYRKVFGELLQ